MHDNTTEYIRWTGSGSRALSSGVTTATAVRYADPENGPLDGIVDLIRYPIDQLVDAGSEVVADARRQLAANGCVTLEGFLTADGLATAAREIAACAEHVTIRQHQGSVYARTDLESDLDSADPRLVKMGWHAGHVTRDMIPPFSTAHRLYVSPVFKAFVAAVVDREQIFEYADPLAGLVATVLPPGGCYPWHYDTNEYVVTIMTQQPDAGGAFEYHQDLRCPYDENLAGLSAVLTDRPERPARVVQASPGDLQLFLGRYSLHRVTEVGGKTARHVVVLSYGDRPGVIGPVDRTRSVYGRITEAHLVAEQMRLAVNDGLIL